MELTSYWQVLQESASTFLDISLDAHQMQQFQTLYNLLIQENKTINLTRITTLADFGTLHLLDSLTLVPFLKALPSSFMLMDIGSGAGFPALPLAIVFPPARIIAVESAQKKARFITQAAEALELAGVSVLAERSETLAHEPKYREQCDVVTARAVASLNVLVELCLPFLKTGGTFYAMKTHTSLETEIPLAQHAIHEMGGKVSKIEPITLPELKNHALAVIQKVKSTPAKYPRQPGIPAKRPL